MSPAKEWKEVKSFLGAERAPLSMKAEYQSTRMRTLNPEVLGVVVIVVMFSFLVWYAWLFIACIADEWSAPAAHERNVPAVKTYR